MKTIAPRHADTMHAGMVDALVHRMNPAGPLTEAGRQYRGMSLLEMGRDLLERRGTSTRGLSRMAIAGELLRGSGMGTTGDFASVLADVANKRLRQAYLENRASYRLWARRAADLPDFKPVTAVQISSAPDLLRTNEHGEFKYGSLVDSGETYQAITYGRIVSLTRQAIVNDDLRSFERLVTAFGNSAARLENRLVYSILTSNAALADGVTLFHANHGNVGTGAGSALQLSALTAARAAMRVQKGLQSEELNVTPEWLIVPAALEQTAYQLTSANYVPAAQGSVSEFRSGGKTSLAPVVESLLDANSATAWYLAANGGLIDTVEYAYIDGADAPLVEQKPGFEVDGVSFRCRHDFAAKAIDYRGLYRAAGA